MNWLTKCFEQILKDNVYHFGKFTIVVETFGVDYISDLAFQLGGKYSLQILEKELQKLVLSWSHNAFADIEYSIICLH